MNNKSWIVEVEQAPDGEFFIQLTDEMLQASGFAIGDELDWKDNKDGSYTLVKKTPKKYVMVEAIAQYRMRYCVELNADDPSEWAMDTVTMNEAKEFSQYWLGETITSHRVVDQEEILKLSDEDNDYCKSWSDEKKLEVFVTPIDYKPEE